MKCNSFGENLRRIRKLYGMTQEDVARAVGVNKYTISKYECSKLYPNKKLHTKFISIFNVLD